MSVELKIEKVAHGGVFVARPEGKVVFVEDVLPGEIVEAEIIDEKSNFLRATPTKILEASPHRQKHIWEDSERGAGGADFGHIQLEYQRELKSQVLREALTRFAGIESDVAVEPLDETDGLHYRTRIQIHFDSRARASVKKVRSDELVPIRSYPLAEKALQDVALSNPNKYSDARVSFAIDSFGNIVDSEQKSPAQLSQVVGERLFELSPQTFWQAHRLAPTKLAGEVQNLLANFQVTELLDLYSGVGLFAATSAARYPAVSVRAVELNKQAVKDGKKSSRDLKNLSFETSDVLVYLRQRAESLDTVVLDPPRSGANNKVLSHLARLGAKNIVYVACDPVSAARDIKQLSEIGYTLRDIKSLDLFPHTHHFETIMSFQLSNL
jgi:tRNA/tmRNA/rRNA uracil-C5-methylase (TrmA/RlmC/RlmD family)